MRQTGKTTKKIKPGMIETLIGEKTKIEGAVQVSGTTRVDGYIKGTVQSDDMLIIGNSGRLDGDSQAKNMLVAGKVKGNLTIAEKTEITSQGVVMGDIWTKMLVIEEGAVFTGKCHMEAEADMEEESDKLVDEKMESSLNEAAASTILT